MRGDLHSLVGYGMYEALPGEPHTPGRIPLAEFEAYNTIVCRGADLVEVMDIGSDEELRQVLDGLDEAPHRFLRRFLDLYNGARLLKTAPVLREMILNFVGEWNLGLCKSY